MWKKLLIGIVLISGATIYFCPCRHNETIPVLPSDEYWGPGQPRKLDQNIRPFKINISKDIIDDLKLRLKNTRTSAKPLEDAGWTYGIDSNYLRSVVEYWRTKYDWNQRQELLNEFPQFKTNIQGLDIHFYHVKPIVPKDGSIRVVPLLLVHGWPGSVVEFQKIIPMLTTVRSGQNFVFEVIAPSLPGYGFSEAANRPGLGPAQMAIVMNNLMNRLGFDKFYTQGGDWGSAITTILSILHPDRVLGTHLNMCTAPSSKVMMWTMIGAFMPSLVVSDEHWSKMYPLSEKFSWLLEESGYLHIQATKPDTVGTGLSDSPAGLAAYILEKFSTWTNMKNKLKPNGNLLEKFTMDELLDNLMLYWVTNSITTSQRLYAENFSSQHRDLKLDEVPVRTPVGCAIFPHELLYQSESLLRTKFPNLVRFTHMARGGHFAAFEEPQLLADEIWAFVDSLENKPKTDKNTKAAEL